MQTPPTLMNVFPLHDVIVNNFMGKRVPTTLNQTVTGYTLIEDAWYSFGLHACEQLHACSMVINASSVHEAPASTTKASAL